MRLKNTEHELVAWRVELACEPRCLISNPFPLRPLHLGALWNMSFERVEDNFYSINELSCSFLTSHGNISVESRQAIACYLHSSRA